MKRGRKKIQLGELKSIPGAPELPEDIAKDPAKLREWKSLVEAMSAQGNLQKTDGEIVALAARTLTRLSQVEVELDALDGLTLVDKRGDTKPHPLLAIHQTYITKVTKLLSDLRLNPATRSKGTLPTDDALARWVE